MLNNLHFIFLHFYRKKPTESPIWDIHCDPCQFQLFQTIVLTPLTRCVSFSFLKPVLELTSVISWLGEYFCPSGYSSEAPMHKFGFVSDAFVDSQPVLNFSLSTGLQCSRTFHNVITPLLLLIEIRLIISPSMLYIYVIN